MRGRKPKPTALKKLAGNPGKRPLNEFEPQPAVPQSTPYAPRHLTHEAKREWNRMVKLLIDLGLYTEVDRAALSMYCQAWGRWVTIEIKIGEGIEEITCVSNRGNEYLSPLVTASKMYWEQMRKMLAEFGLTPSSRARLHVEPPDDEPDLAELLFGKAASRDDRTD